MRYLEAAIGFEPMNNGFANRRLGPLGYAAFASVYRLCSRLVGGAFPVECPSKRPSQTGNRPAAWSNTGFSGDIIADLPGIVKSRASPAIFTLSHLVSNTAVLPALLPDGWCAGNNRHESPYYWEGLWWSLVRVAGQCGNVGRSQCCLQGKESFLVRGPRVVV